MGRAARQGDPGEVVAFVSLDDALIASVGGLRGALLRGMIRARMAPGFALRRVQRRHEAHACPPAPSPRRLRPPNGGPARVCGSSRMIPRFVILLPAVVFSVPAVASPAPTLDVLAADASCLIMESETIALTSAVPGNARLGRSGRRRCRAARTVDRGTRIIGFERATAEVARARAESDVIERRRVREVAAAEVRLDRQRQLRDRNVTADQVVEDAETEVEVARLGVEEARFEREVARLEYERTLAVLPAPRDTQPDQRGRDPRGSVGGRERRRGRTSRSGLSGRSA